MDIFNVSVSSLKAIRKNPKFLFPSLLLVLFGIVVLWVLGLLFISSIPGQVAGSHQLYTRITTAITRIVPFIAMVGIIVFLAGVAVKGMYIDLCHNWKRFPKKPSLRKSFKVAISKYKELLVFEVIAVIAEAILALVILGPLVYMAQNSIIYPYLNGIIISGPSFLGFSIVAAILICLYIILAIVASILLWLGSSIVVLDNSDAISALKASITIGKREMPKIFGTLVMAYIIVAIALFISRILQLIPFIGVIISFLISIGIMAFIELLAPMYYLNFHKKKQ